MTLARIDFRPAHAQPKAGRLVVTRISSAPRWLFFRLAGLVLMHLAIALITYNLLVRLAPVTGRARGAVPGG